jgi:hypothetical protein
MNAMIRGRSRAMLLSSSKHVSIWRGASCSGAIHPRIAVLTSDALKQPSWAALQVRLSRERSITQMRSVDNVLWS